LNCATANGSYVGQRTLLDGAASDQLLVGGEEYEGKCPMEIYGSQVESLCEEGTAVLKEVNVGRTESNLLHPTPIQKSELNLHDSRSLKKAELSTLIDTNYNMDEYQKECLIDLVNRVKLSEIDPEATKEAAVEMNSLRSCFRKELKKVKDSQKSGNGTDVPSLCTMTFYF
jgi:hypothetical protein